MNPPTQALQHVNWCYRTRTGGTFLRLSTVNDDRQPAVQGFHTADAMGMCERAHKILLTETTGNFKKRWIH